MEKNKIKENKMGVMPTGKLLFSMALPMMISMLVQALYNVVDSVYVAQLSQDALNAVSLSFPIQNLMIALGSGIGVGMNALLSKSLGEKNYEQANKYAENGIFLSLLVCYTAYIRAYGRKVVFRFTDGYSGHSAGRRGLFNNMLLRLFRAFWSDDF